MSGSSNDIDNGFDCSGDVSDNFCVSLIIKFILNGLSCESRLSLVTLLSLFLCFLCFLFFFSPFLFFFWCLCFFLCFDFLSLCLVYNYQNITTGIYIYI